MFNVQVTMDQHIKAFDWLEEHLGDKIFQFDTDDISAMVEQVTCE